MTDAYLDISPSLAVRDEVRAEFDTEGEVSSKSFRLAVLDEPSFIAHIQRSLPNAKVIPTKDFADFFENRLDNADAMMMPAESASAWTLLYPEFHVATPWKGEPKWPLAYLIGNDDREMRRFLDNWIYLKKRDGTIEKLYDHWILGKTAEPDRPRWSIIRDVFGWVD